MKDRFSTEKLHQPYFVGGILAAHASHSETGFRLRDAVFYINFISNWLEYFLPETVIGVSNIQVSRYLKGLSEEGVVKPSRHSKHPRYTLTRPGILELVRRLSAPNFFSQFEHFLFSYFFLRSYGARLEKLLRDVHGELPTSFRIELESLCNPEVIRLKQQKHIEEQLRKLEDRRLSTRGTISIVEKAKQTDDSVLNEVERKYPYQLNSERSMQKLLASFTPEERKWELSEGNSLRLNLLWQPAEELLKKQLAITKTLS